MFERTYFDSKLQLVETFFKYDNNGDPNPDPHVFGPPGSRSISKKYGTGSFPFFM
jgi:hypothetical protein